MLQRFRKGQSWELTPASQLNSIIDVAEKAEATAEWCKAQLSRVPEETQRPLDVIVTEAAAGSRTVMIQQVEYVNIPPKPCDDGGCYIRRVGSPFEAYPDFGWRVSDFEDDVVASADELDTDVAYLRAFFRRGVWVVEKEAKGGGATWKFAFITEADELDGPTVKVQFMKVGEAPDLTEDGEEKDVFCWPGTSSTDYYPLAVNSGVPVPPIVRVEKMSGEWFVRQFFPFFTKQPEISRLAGDCTPR